MVTIQGIDSYRTAFLMSHDTVYLLVVYVIFGFKILECLVSHKSHYFWDKWAGANSADQDQRGSLIRVCTFCHSTPCMIRAASRENLSSGFPTRSVSNWPAQLQSPAKSIEILDLTSIGILQSK